MPRFQITGYSLYGRLLLIAGIVLFLWNGLLSERQFQGASVDFESYYYASGCFAAHCDPYNPRSLSQYYVSSAGAQVYKEQAARDVVTSFINLPTSLLLFAPLAQLPLPAAFALWSAFGAACCCLACILLSRICAPHAPVLSALLIALALTSSGAILRSGNAVVPVVSLTIIAAWCFIRGRYGWAGVLALALALVLKPHDAGFVWLFFLLAGAAQRRRALQTLAVTAVFALAAASWAFHVSPHWPREQHANIVAMSTLGGMNDPGPGSLVDRKGVIVVSLQTIVAVFRNSPAFYNPVTYALCGVPLLVWALRVYRVSPSGDAAWLALAAVVPLTLLVTYHKVYDTQLLLLLLPACFLLWRRDDTRGQAAFLLTAGAVFFTTGVPLGVYYALTSHIPMDLHSLGGQLSAVLLFRPVPLLLIALAAFYLTVFLRQESPAAPEPRRAR